MVANRFKMYVPTDDLSLAPHLMMEGYWESWISVACYLMVRLAAPSSVINIGANLGYYSFMAASLLPEAEVVAYEPQPNLVDLIRRSATVNGFNNVTVKQRALGALPGSTWLRKFGDFYGSAMVTSDAASIGSTATSVEINTLDLEDTSPLEFLVIDAEGHEYEIFKGAEERLGRSDRTIAMLEFSASRYSEKHAFIEWLVSHGFTTYQIAYDGRVQKITPNELHEAEKVIDLVIARGYSTEFFDPLE